MALEDGKRRRTRVFRGVLLALTLVTTGLTIRIVLFVADKPAITVNYAIEYNRLTRPAGYDPNDNAAPYYRDACKLVVEMPGPLWSPGDFDPERASGTERRVIEAWVAANTEALQLIEQAVEKPYFWVALPTLDTSDPAFAQELPPQTLRQLALCLDYKARLLAAQGDIPAAFRCVTTTCRVARHLTGSNRTRTETLIGMTINSLAQSTFLALLEHAQSDAQALANLQAELEGTLSDWDMPSFEAEGIRLRDALQRYFTDDGKGDGHLVPRAIYRFYRQTHTPPNELAENAAWLKHLHIAWTQPGKRQTQQAVETLVQAANRLGEQTAWELHAKGTSHEDRLRPSVEGNYFLQAMQIDQMLARAITIHYSARASAEALVTTIAILRFHQDRGQWPQSLEQLAASGYVRQIPTDPYSGGSLVYRPAGDSFILYSWGRDFDDDGGTPSRWGNPPAGGDQVFWPRERQK